MTKEEQDILFGRYERYYSKIPGIVTLIDSRSIEPYLTDDDILAPDIDEDLYMSLNHPNSMRKIICENFYDGCGLYEGLITAYPLKKVTQQYVEYCNENLPNDLKDLEISDVLPMFSNVNGKLIDKTVKSSKDIDQLAVYFFPAYKGNDVKRHIAEIARKLQICGYDMSYCKKLENTKLSEQYRDKIDVYRLQFEARYSQEVIKLSKTLYHVTDEKNINKIRKQGLVPKSKSPEFKYKDRIYLFNTDDMKKAFEYKNLKVNNLKDNGIDTSDMKFCILKIDRDKLQASSLYKTGKITFYYDPCYGFGVKQLQDSPGIFTYNNIPRELIEDDFVMIP